MIRRRRGTQRKISGAVATRCTSIGGAVQLPFEIIYRSLVPGVGALQPTVVLAVEEIGKIHSRITTACSEVDQSLCAAIKIKNSTQAITGPLHTGQALANFDC